MFDRILKTLFINWFQFGCAATPTTEKKRYLGKEEEDQASLWLLYKEGLTQESYLLCNCVLNDAQIEKFDENWKRK